MIHQPFFTFAPFVDRFDIKFFTKADDIQTDSDLANCLKTDRIASLHQAHGNTVVILREPSSRTEFADAIATDEPNLWITIRAADCQQLVIYEPKSHVCAVVHAGWKGLQAGIIASTFKALKSEWNIDPSQTYVGIGPSLCTSCAEFTDPVTELAGLSPTFFEGRHADLQGIADAELEEIGVPKNQTERSKDCTKCKSDVYWSYRGGDKEKVKEGYTNVIACVLYE